MTRSRSQPLGFGYLLIRLVQNSDALLLCSVMKSNSFFSSILYSYVPVDLTFFPTRQNQKLILITHRKLCFDILARHKVEVTQK